ncbi:MAG: diguanylate cyclase [Desulfuromusa sp.]|nr:diguanylate cyclase [Desulfuromusa sp.]
MGSKRFSGDIDASNPDRVIQIADRIWWVGHMLPGDPFQCHVYLIENGDQSVLIDPGSKLTFKNTLGKIEEIIPFSHIRYFICQHQDPDITAALPLIDELVNRDDAVIVSHWRTIALLKHYGLDLKFLCIEEQGWKLDIGQCKLEFILTPYLHFAGAFCTFDCQTATLFSSDLFGGFTEEWQLVAKDESYFEAIRPFHEHYMPSREILYHGLTKLEKYPAKMIAPQHGSIIPEKLIPFMFTQLKNIDCGLYLLTQTSTDIVKLTKLNRILQKFMKSMAVYKAFREIAEECLTLVSEVIPVTKLEFYALEGDLPCLLFSSESMFRPIETFIPEEFDGLIGDSFSQWLEIYGSHVAYYCGVSCGETDPVCRLPVPLLDPETKVVQSIAVFYLSSQVSPEDEVVEILRQLSVPLSVAVERELIHRSLEQERQKFYEQSIRDPLTNLYTRLYMRESVQRLFAINDRDPNATVGLISLDIDHFKLVNDTFGHQAGDQVLQEVAWIILRETRDSDIQIRLGGEEFAIFVASEPIESIKEIAERIRKAVANMSFVEAMENHKFSLSSGVIVRRPDEDLISALHRADNLLYQAKHQGRNVVCVETEE